MHRFVAVAIAVAPAEATPPPADVDDKGRLLREGRYAELAEAFAREYDQTGDPALLFSQAQALRRAGDCPAAIDVFERFIATDPPATDIEASRAAIAECREILARQQPPPPEPAPTPAPAPTQPQPVRPWYADPAGGVLVGLGVAFAVTGAGLFGAAYTHADRNVGSEAALEDRRRDARAMWGTGLGLLAGGGVLVVAGAIRWGLLARAQKRRTVDVVWSGWGGLTLRF